MYLVVQEQEVAQIFLVTLPTINIPVWLTRKVILLAAGKIVLGTGGTVRANQVMINLIPSVVSNRNRTISVLRIA